jgi:glycosyltransferase involved in cell wall biosynthesis
MFGWEFPPFNTGGLGTACYGLTKGLSNNKIEVTLVLPYIDESLKSEFVKLISTGNIKIKRIDSLLTPYMTSSVYNETLKQRQPNHIYGSSLFAEVYRYSKIARDIVKKESFDIIHCHDWMTYGAGINAKKISGKPLVIHVHATEFDRTGGNNINQCVYELEKEGMLFADSVIAVSAFTKNKITTHYGINPEKINIVHNAVEFNNNNSNEFFEIKKYNKIVLFLGRLTIQKGPDYFLYAAKKVLEYNQDVRFIVAGSGDMEDFLIEKAADLDIADKVLFTGFLRGKDIDRAYQMADLYVMPSVSEPFGITPLEAIQNNTPVIISKQSGVSEVLTNCLKVDFWDIDELANKILAVLNYKVLHQNLKENGSLEIRKFDWNISAKRCIDVYNNLLNNAIA